MRWLGYALGLLVGTFGGFWLYAFWESDLTGVGSPPPPKIDLYLPAALLVATVAFLATYRRGD